MFAQYLDFEIISALDHFIEDVSRPKDPIFKIISCFHILDIDRFTYLLLCKKYSCYLVVFNIFMNSQVLQIFNYIKNEEK